MQRPLYRIAVEFILSVLTVAALLLLIACTNHQTNKDTNPAASTTPPHPENFTRSRKAFAQDFAQIKEGMPADQAQIILGKPDDIRTQTDPGGISLNHTREIWSYGADRHLGFATLGTITIDDNNRVQYLVGTAGADELVAALGESELRRLLRVLAHSTGNWSGGYQFNPRDTITAVNALQPLGKKIGVAVMKEFIRINFDSQSTGDEGLILIMRALFEVPPSQPANAQSQPATTEEDPFIVIHPGFFRSPMLGSPSWYPENLAEFPRFPLVIIDDIPLLPNGGYILSGFPEPAATHLQFLEQAASWRTRPLQPGNDPLQTLAKIMALLPPKQQKDQQLTIMLGRQLLRLIDTVYRQPPTDDEDECCSPDIPLAAFAAALREVSPLHIHWNPQSQCYVRADGSTLPPIIKLFYRRTILDPNFHDDSIGTCTIAVERITPRRISIDIDRSVPRANTPPFQFRIVQLTNPQKILLNETTKAPEDAGFTSSTTYTPALSAGQRIRIEVSQGSHHFLSPPIQL